MSVGGKWWRKLGRMIKAKTREYENAVKQRWDRYKGLESEGEKG